MNWRGGAPASAASNILMLAIFATVACGFLVESQSDNAFLVLLVLFPLIFISQMIDNRNARRANEAAREEAARNQPALDGEAPLAIPPEYAENREFPLIDRDSGEVVARLRKPQLTSLIEQHRSWGLDPNDFYIMTETVQVLEEASADPDLVMALRQAMRGRDDLELRWVLPEDLEAAPR